MKLSLMSCSGLWTLVVLMILIWGCTYPDNGIVDDDPQLESELVSNDDDATQLESESISDDDDDDPQVESELLLYVDDGDPMRIWF